MKRIKLFATAAGILGLTASVGTTLLLSSCANVSTDTTLNINFGNIKSIKEYDYTKYGKHLKGYDYTKINSSDIDPSFLPITKINDPRMLKSLSKQLTTGVLLNSLMVDVLKDISYFDLPTSEITSSLQCKFNLITKDDMMLIHDFTFKFDAKVKLTSIVANRGAEFDAAFKIIMKNTADTPIHTAYNENGTQLISFGGAATGTKYGHSEITYEDNQSPEIDDYASHSFALIPADADTTVLPPPPLTLQ